MIWDDHHRQLWVHALNAETNLSAAADHDPTPAMLSGTDADRTRTALQAHVAHLGGVDAVLGHPATREEFASIADRARVRVDDVATMLRHLR